MKIHEELRQKYINYFTKLKHTVIPYSPLVLQNDATTLFTTAGMQPLIENLSGKPSSYGKRLVNIQPCFRTKDIDEVGDNRHTTFFEMLGNWSLGDYFKQEQLEWIFVFFTDILGLDRTRLFVTVFKGSSEIPFDSESEKIWKKLGIEKQNIYQYGDDENWWSRAGKPSQMPAGEIGGTSSEIFFDFKIPHNKSFGKVCHPNCNCGRFMEIGNSVFLEYIKTNTGKLDRLVQKNVDFGGGFERILACLNNNPDIFQSDVFKPIISSIERITGKTYDDNRASFQIIADHIKASVMLLNDKVVPSNKEQGYVLRRLIRRAVMKMRFLTDSIDTSFEPVIKSVLQVYDGMYDISATDFEYISLQLRQETDKFKITLENGLKIIQSLKTINGKTAFDLYQSYGFPFEITQELMNNRGLSISKVEFDNASKQHSNLSKKNSRGIFKGGLADNSQKVIQYHTCTHLLHQALHEIFGMDIRQEGSNITGERLRFDFYSPCTITPDDLNRISQIINDKITAGLAVFHLEMTKNDAHKIGARSFFKEKYPDIVTVYFIGGTKSNVNKTYSKEFCGGPHVKNTKEIGTITVYKLKKIGASMYRIYVK